MVCKNCAYEIIDGCCECRQCKWCRKILTKQPEERIHNFNKRKYCNKSCSAHHREAIRSPK